MGSQVQHYLPVPWTTALGLKGVDHPVKCPMIGTAKNLIGKSGHFIVSYKTKGRERKERGPFCGYG